MIYLVFTTQAHQCFSPVLFFLLRFRTEFEWSLSARLQQHWRDCDFEVRLRLGGRPALQRQVVQRDEGVFPLRAGRQPAHAGVRIAGSLGRCKTNYLRIFSNHCTILMYCKYQKMKIYLSILKQKENQS